MEVVKCSYDENKRRFHNQRRHWNFQAEKKTFKKAKKKPKKSLKKFFEQSRPKTVLIQHDWFGYQIFI